MKTFTRSPVAGINSTASPILLPREASPDAENVLFYAGGVEKRGGFPTLFRDRMLGSCVRNTGYRTKSRITAGGATNVDHLIVPGCLIAGHRHAYEDQTALTVEFFFEIADQSLTGQHGGNDSTGATGMGGPAPFTIQVRPLISKGPIKRTTETTGTLFNQAGIVWNTTVATQWGTASGSGMPFCVYIWNNGTGTAPVWQFRLSAHVLVAGSWTLQTVTSSVTPVEGARYHIIAAVSGSRVALRVARIFANETPAYTDNQTTFTGTLATNLCPIQVLDCPQQFVEATNVGSATQRPGLNLPSGGASGGYFMAAKRAEGRIEDIVVWSGDQIASVASARDRTTKLDLTQVQPLNYWSMLGPGTDMVVEQTGRGNHLYFVPRGPVTDTSSGSKAGNSWFFNGQTAYASIDLSGPDSDLEDRNWRYNDTAHTLMAQMQAAVRLNVAHGLHVEFWVDAIEPNFEQVVIEMHSVLRVAINPAGNIVAYCRDGDTLAVANSLHIGELYQGPVTSTFTVQPGRRYAITVLRKQGGTQLDLYSGGVLDASATGLHPNSNNVASQSWPISGLTVGMGSHEHMIRGPNQDSTTIARPNEFNTDPRSGFVGRVESFKIVGTNDAPSLTPTYRLEDQEDWRFPDNRAGRNLPSFSRQVVQPADPQDNVRIVGNGASMHLSGHQFEGERKARYLVVDDSVIAQGYTLHRQTIDLAAVATGLMGHLSVSGIGYSLFHVLASYVLSERDLDFQYSGAYTLGREKRYDPTGAGPTVANQKNHPTKAVHVQRSSEVDALGTYPSLFRHCVESDVANDSQTVIFTAPLTSTHRLRPYTTRSPAELGPQWDAGIVPPLPGTNPVSLLAEWEQQEGGRRFTIAASARTIYWAKPLWEPDSPFTEAPKACVWMQGGYGSHLLVNATASQLEVTGTGTKTTVVFETWVKPIRLDGRRLIAAKTRPSTSQLQHNWVVSTQDGSIEISGTLGGGARTWSYLEVDALAADTTPRRHASLRASVWNHLHVTIETSGVTVRVNGELVPMLDANTLGGTAKRDLLTGAAGDQVGSELYVGGLPAGRETMSFTTVAGATTVTVRMESWCGFFSQTRVRNQVDTTNWPAGKSGFPPRARYLDDANTYLLLDLNEADGPWMHNTAALAAGQDAESRVVEFIPVASNLEDSSAHRYSWLVFRDRLIVANGESRTMQMRYTSLADRTPLVVENLGILAPVAIDSNVSATTTAGATVTPAEYVIWISFVTQDGKESEPVFVGRNVLGGAVGTLTLSITNLPRSPDPQVTTRRLYVSAIGGGTPVFNRDLDENNGYAHDVEVFAATGLAPAVGEHLPAPRGRNLAVAGASLVVGYLTEEPAGQNAFAFSTGEEPSYFTLTSTVVIDSQDGKPLIGIRGNLGQVFLSKRDSVFQVAVGAVVSAVDVEASLRLVYGSDGIGGGMASAANLLFGAGDRGVFLFDNTNAIYLSEAIEATWRDQVDATDNGLVAQQGFVRRHRSEYWLSVRRIGETALDRMLVTAYGGQKAWAILSVPRHHVVAALSDTSQQAQFMAIGTDSGTILRYRDDVLIDLADEAPMATGPVTLTGSAGLSGSSTSLTMSGARFDTRGGGLAGATVLIVWNGGTTTRRIASNTTTTLTWTEPLASWTSYTSFEIGGYTARWTSPWIADQQPNREQNLRHVGLEFKPASGSATLRVASARQGDPTDQPFPTTQTAYEEFAVPMTDGWVRDMPTPRHHTKGHYHRIEVRTDGIQTPFTLLGYGLEMTADMATSHGGRTS